MIQTTLFPNTFKSLFTLSNDDIANIFEQVADLLEAQGDDYYRIRAYRKGAQSIRAQHQSVVDLFAQKGTEGLTSIPYIGKGLAGAIAELATTGDLALLTRLEIDVSPEDLFTTVPGIGQLLARRIYRGLGIRSLAELKQAVDDGTLLTAPGFGPERVEHVRQDLELMLSAMPAQSGSLPIRSKEPKKAQGKPQGKPQSRTQEKAVLTKNSRQNVALEQKAYASVINRPNRWQSAEAITTAQTTQSPSVELLIEVDRHYRYLAKAGQLRMVTPRRFNPEKRQWLPVMTLKKEGWSFNVLYSNTARAHELKKTNDWVVINYEKKGHKGQCTVVTETKGVRRGQRVVRGKAIAAA